MNFSTLYTILVTVGPVTPEIATVTIACCRNEGKLLLRAFFAVRQMSPRFCFATTC